jgi:hypothetical protein
MTGKYPWLHRQTDPRFKAMRSIIERVTVAAVVEVVLSEGSGVGAGNLWPRSIHEEAERHYNSERKAGRVGSLFKEE